jgi:hypothetical protein
MGRPKGSKDKTKRRRKTRLDSKQERELVKDYTDGLAPYLIRQKYNLSKGALSRLLKIRNIKVRINPVNICKWQIIKDLEKLEKNISGIYAIVFQWSSNNTDYIHDDATHGFKLNDHKVYIGSSVCIRKRLMSHLRKTNSGVHDNLELFEYASNNKYKMTLHIVEECEEKDLLQREGEIIRSIGISLINKNVMVDSNDIEPWLQQAILNDGYVKKYYYDENKSYNGSLCKCSSYASKDGYGKLRVTVNEETKYLIKHRVAYWEKHKEYPELVRHLCNNKACYNPDHLAKGSHRQNNLDKRGNFAKEFEKVWVMYEGDLIKISKHYSHKWVSNQPWKGHNVSYAVYSWEKKLNLGTKYPDIVQARRSKATIKV